jgi:hypothetical protein
MVVEMILAVGMLAERANMEFIDALLGHACSFITNSAFDTVFVAHRVRAGKAFGKR